MSKEDDLKEGKALFELVSHDEMIDIWFERWFNDYSATQGINVTLFKAVLKHAFKTGWLKCEVFYS
jgi:hypothetical protein